MDLSGITGITAEEAAKRLAFIRLPKAEGIIYPPNSKSTEMSEFKIKVKQSELTDYIDQLKTKLSEVKDLIDLINSTPIKISSNLSPTIDGDEIIEMVNRQKPRLRGQ